MVTVLISRGAKSVACPNCGRLLRNLVLIGLKRQIGCLCGATVRVERRAVDALPEIEQRKRVG